MTLKAGGLISGLLTEYFPSLAGRVMDSGFVRISSDSGLVAGVVFGTHNLSVLSAIPPQ
jgi:hypothetical protein